MIKSGEADVGSARDVAHRRRVIILLGKNARGVAENELELLIVFRKIVHNDLVLGLWSLGFELRTLYLVLCTLSFVLCWTSTSN